MTFISGYAVITIEVVTTKLPRFIIRLPQNKWGSLNTKRLKKTSLRLPQQTARGRKA